MGEHFGGVALLPTQDEHVAHLSVRGAEQALGAGAIHMRINNRT